MKSIHIGVGGTGGWLDGTSLGFHELGDSC